MPLDHPGSLYDSVIAFKAIPVLPAPFTDFLGPANIIMIRHIHMTADQTAYGTLPLGNKSGSRLPRAGRHDTALLMKFLTMENIATG